MKLNVIGCGNMNPLFVVVMIWVIWLSITCMHALRDTTSKEVIVRFLFTGSVMIIFTILLVLFNLI